MQGDSFAMDGPDLICSDVEQQRPEAEVREEAATCPARLRAARKQHLRHEQILRPFLRGLCTVRFETTVQFCKNHVDLVLWKPLYKDRPQQSLISAPPDGEKSSKVHRYNASASYFCGFVLENSVAFDAKIAVIQDQC